MKKSQLIIILVVVIAILAVVLIVRNKDKVGLAPSDNCPRDVELEFNQVPNAADDAKKRAKIYCESEFECSGFACKLDQSSISLFSTLIKFDCVC